MILLYTDQFIFGTTIQSQWDLSLRRTFEKYCQLEKLDFVLKFTDDGIDENIIIDGIDTMFVSLHSNIGSSKKCWSTSRIKAIRLKNPNLKIHVFFGDMELAEQQIFALSIYRYVDFIHYSGKFLPILSKFMGKLKYHQPIIDADTLKNRNQLIKEKKVLGYTGRLRQDRLNTIEYINNNSELNVEINGGEREQNLNYNDYLYSLKSCDFNLSFSRVGLRHVINLRPFEVTAINGWFIERLSIETARFFRPFQNYIPYTNNRNLRTILQRTELENFISYLDTCDIEKKIMGEWNYLSFWEDCLSGRAVSVMSINESLKYSPMAFKFLFYFFVVQQYLLFLPYIALYICKKIIK